MSTKRVEDFVRRGRAAQQTVDEITAQEMREYAQGIGEVHPSMAEKRTRMKNPKTSAEWQEAVDAAAACRAIADCMMYGLLTGPSVDVARCDWILSEGERRGVRPSKPALDLAVGYAAAYNAEREG